MALANYPARPSYGESGGPTGWPAKRSAYDDALEANIKEAHRVGTEAVQTDNLRLPIVLTEAEYAALTPKIPGQLYITTGG